MKGVMRRKTKYLKLKIIGKEREKMNRAWKSKLLSALMTIAMIVTTVVTPVSAEELAQPAEASAPVQYKVTVDTAEGGAIKLKDDVELYTPGDTVQMEVETAENYELSEIKTDPEVEIDMSNMTFTMPEQDVRVIPSFNSLPVTNENESETEESIGEDEETTDNSETDMPEESDNNNSDTSDTTEKEDISEETTEEDVSIEDDSSEETEETAQQDETEEADQEEEVEGSEETAEEQLPLLITPNTLAVARASGLEFVGYITYITTTVGEFKVNGTTAFCLQHLTPTPETGTSFSEQIYNDANIRKCLYYGWDGPEQWSGFGSKEQGYVVTSLALSYYYDGEDSLGILPDGTMSHQLGLADFFDYIESQPDVGSADMSFSQTNVEAVLSADRTQQVTSNITFRSSERNTITIALDDGMTLVNRTTGETLTGNATIKGGDTFYLTAPLTKNETWSTGTLYGSMGRFNAVVAVTPGGVQNLGYGQWASDPDHHVELTVKWEAAGRVQIQKSDSETNETTPQGGATLQGAQFTLYTNEACTEPAQDINGNNVVLTTGADGRTNLSGYLVFGTYYAKETAAPTGYLLSDEVIRITLPTGGDDPTTAQLSVGEDVIRGGVRVEKWDADLNRKQAQGTATLQGAQFEIISLNNNDVIVDGESYSNGQVVATITTNADGVASTAEDLLPYGSYRIREVAAPTGYNNSGTIQRDFNIREDGVVVNLNTSDTAIKNNVIRGGVRIEKWDSELNSNNAQGSATLQGAQFQIISFNSAPVVVNGETYNNNEVIITITTNESGVAQTSANLLPYGNYIIREVTAPEGYNNTGVIQRTFTIRENGVIVNMNQTGTAIKNDVIRGDIQLVKFAEPVDEEEDQMSPLEGIVFEITSKTTGESVRITTDENGYASTTQLGISDRGNLVYDTYVVSEVNTPEGLTPVDDFEVTISEEGRTLYYILEDQQIISPVSVVKVDSTTGETIPIANTEFQLLDADKNVITMTTYYPDTVEHETFLTDDSGSFTFPEKLPYGTYYLRELNAPEGYLRGEDLEFKITEGHDWADPLEVEYADAPAMGQIEITKVEEGSGEVLSGAEFTISAAEDIITPDGTLRAAAGDVVDTITTNEEGYAISKELHLGKYTVEETKQPAGYVRWDKTWDVELTYADQDTAVVVESLTIENVPTTIIIDKKVTGEDTRLEGVQFAVWNKAMLPDGEENPVDPEMGVKELYTTSAEGTIRIERLLPGTYCVQEVQGVTGYAMDSEIHEFTITEDGRIEGEDHAIITVENAETEITETNAYDVETGTHEGLPQTSTKLKDIVSIENLQPGEEYTLRGVIVNSETGDPIQIPADSILGIFEDRSITAEQTFTATESVMDVPVEFTFDSSEMDGLTITVYEYLYQNGKEISNHTDPDDEKQQVTFPDMEIHTTALEQNTQSHQAYTNEVGGTTSITDTVEITGIVPGLDYTLKGVVMDQETGEPLLNADGEKITVEKVITPEESNLTVDMEFVLDSNELAGKSIVIFEYLYHNDEEIESHEDIDDEDQTVTFVTPEIHTTAIDQDTMSHHAYIDENTVIVDTVDYTGLVTGENLKYIMYGTPMDQETKQPLTDKDGNQIWVEKEFTPTESEGSVEMEFTFDTSDLAGKSIVFFEYLYLITEDGELPVAEHEDINDEDQTVTFATPEIHTTALGKDSGTHEVIAKEDTVIIDTVEYKGIVANGKLKYIMRGTPMDKATQQPLTDKDGNQIWVEKEFTPTEANGSVEMEFTLDTSEMNGESIVFYEYLYLVTEDGEIPVTSHEDINDVDQTVQVKVGSLTATMPGNSGLGMRTVKTGDITNFLPYIVALLLAGAAVTVIVIRKRREGLKEHESQE